MCRLGLSERSRSRHYALNLGLLAAARAGVAATSLREIPLPLRVRLGDTRKNDPHVLVSGGIH